MRLLALDGGGIRGIIPATVLAEIERRTGRAVHELFDLIVGTSTGGILALGLTAPGEGGAPRFTAGELLERYADDGPRIFSRSPLHAVRSLHQLTGPKYPAGRLEDVLRDQLGEVRLADAMTDVMISAYELEMRTPFFFRSSRAREDITYDWAMWQVARATSAAPTFFPPVRLEAHPADDNDHYALIDGGIYANNPAMVAYAEARTRWPDEEMLLVSLGTGRQTDAISYGSARGWGLAGWARPILDVVFDGVSSTVDYEVGRLLEPPATDRSRYWRLDVPLTSASDALDDAGAGNIARLGDEAQRLLRDHDEELERIVSELIRH